MRSYELPDLLEAQRECKATAPINGQGLDAEKIHPYAEGTVFFLDISFYRTRQKPVSFPRYDPQADCFSEYRIQRVNKSKCGLISLFRKFAQIFPARIFENRFDDLLVL
jgi:hypothetical protein